MSEQSATMSFCCGFEIDMMAVNDYNLLYIVQDDFTYFDYKQTITM